MPRSSSASELFVKHGAISLQSVIRKQHFPLLLSLVNCENLIVESVVELDRVFQSSLLCKWRTDLYV